MLKLIEKAPMGEGKGSPKHTWDQPLLKELSQAMMDASICGLGQAAPNPVLSVMKYFPQEVT
jgi:NADH:ubiquinone oxidoreductase subunit F (NADH-binding)